MFLSSYRNSESLGEREMLWKHELQKRRSSKCKFRFAFDIITLTTRASSVFLSSCRDTVLNQSECIFVLGYFLSFLYKSLVRWFLITFPTRRTSHYSESLYPKLRSLTSDHLFKMVSKSVSFLVMCFMVLTGITSASSHPLDEITTQVNTHMKGLSN